MTGGRIPIVGVIGSGVDEHLERARPLGRWLAESGTHLLTGGGAGVMAAVSRAFYETPDRSGSTIGILPWDDDRREPREGYPNPWIEIPILTHLPLSGERGTDPLSRNHVNVLSADVIVALPGGSGTASEVSLALRYGRAITGFLVSREEIPGMPGDVTVRSDLEGVQAFVSSALQSRGLKAVPRSLDRPRSQR